MQQYKIVCCQAPQKGGGGGIHSLFDVLVRRHGSIPDPQNLGHRRARSRGTQLILGEGHHILSGVSDLVLDHISYLEKLCQAALVMFQSRK